MINNKRVILLLIIIVLLVVSLCRFYTSVLIALPVLNNPRGDFATAFPCYWAWKLNPNFIKQNPLIIAFLGGPESKLWNYGPVMHLVTFPLMFLNSYKTAFTIWYICLILFFVCTIYLWYKMLILDYGLHSFTVLTIFIFIWFNFYPFYETLGTVLIEIFELFLLTLSFYFLSKKREIAGGIFLGLAVMTKFLPFIFVPYFLLKKKYKFFAASLLTIALLAILTEVTLGWRGLYTFKIMALPGAEMWNWYALQAIPNMIQRLYSENFGYGVQTRLIYPFSATLTVYILIGLITLFYSLLFIIKRKSRKINYEVAILSILMISLIQHSLTHYLIFLLIPFSLGFQYLLMTYRKTGKVNKYDIFFLTFSFFLPEW